MSAQHTDDELRAGIFARLPVLEESAAAVVNQAIDATFEHLRFVGVLAPAQQPDYSTWTAAALFAELPRAYTYGAQSNDDVVTTIALAALRATAKEKFPAAVKIHLNDSDQGDGYWFNDLELANGKTSTDANDPALTSVVEDLRDDEDVWQAASDLRPSGDMPGVAVVRGGVVIDVHV